MSVSEATITQGIQVDDFDAMGPIDFLVVEFPHRRTPGEGLPMFVDLVDRGVIRVLDLAFIRKEGDGSVRRLSLSDLGPELAIFEGAASNFLQDDDIDGAAEAMSADSTAFVLVFENRWAAGLARTMRRGGGQLVAFGRLPLQGILAALEATEEPQQQVN
jgi:hypothetical protein